MDTTDATAPRRPGKRVVVGAVAAAALVAGGVGWAVVRSGGDSSDGRPTALTLTTKPDALVATGMARLVGRRLYAGSDPISEDLAAGHQVRADIAADLVPVAVRQDAVTDVVVYSAWRYSARDLPAGEAPPSKPVVVGRPSIRVWRGVGGSDELLADGAYAPAVAPGGAIAYAQGVDADLRTDGPYLSRIVVGSLDSPDTRWWTSTPGRYVPVAWSGSHLIAYSVGEDDSTDVVAYSGPDASRTLANAAAVIAVSSDAKQVAVADRRGIVSLIDVASGGIRDAVTLRGQGGPVGDFGRVRPGGGWRDSRIVASTARALVVLDTLPALHVAAVYPYTGTLSGGIREPQFVDGDTVIGTAMLPSTEVPNADAATSASALVVCTLSTSSCAMGSIGATTLSWRRWVTNWSR